MAEIDVPLLNKHEKIQFIKLIQMTDNEKKFLFLKTNLDWNLLEMENIDVIANLRCFENDKPKKNASSKNTKKLMINYKMYYIYDLKISITN
jgi:hypothetical protein